MTNESFRKLDNQLYLIEWILERHTEGDKYRKNGELTDEGLINLRFLETALKIECEKYDKLFNEIKAKELRRPSNSYNGRGWLS